MRIADTEEFGNTVLIVTKTESSDDVLAVWVWSRQRRVHFWGRAAVPWGWWFLKVIRSGWTRRNLYFNFGQKSSGLQIAEIGPHGVGKK